MRTVNAQTSKHLARMATPMTHFHCRCYYRIRAIVRWMVFALVLFSLTYALIKYSNHLDDSMREFVRIHQPNPLMKQGAELP